MACLLLLTCFLPSSHAGSFPQNMMIENFPVWINNYLSELEWESHSQPPQLKHDLLLKSFILGRQFMINNQRPAGNFNYQYDFVRKKMDLNDNQVRQAGALWGLALMYQFQQNELNKGALDRALAFFFENTVPGPAKDALMIAYPGTVHCRTGTVALVALAIIEYLHVEKMGKVKLPDSYRQKLIQALNGYIEHLKHMRLANAHFSESISLATKIKTMRFNPYFDGETLLCLIKAAKYLGYADLIPIIEQSAMVLAKEYTVDKWRNDPDSKLTKGFFQWGCMAFWEYQDAGWKNGQVFGDCLLALAWWMIHVHKTLERTRNTGYAFEGIIHAYHMAKARNLKATLNDLAYTIDTGLYKLTGWQVGGPLQHGNSFLLKYPTNDPLAVGGIMNHRERPPLRIDVTQHQMHAVILALKYVYSKQQ
jgi:UDP-N-acetylmuramoyl-tripeptide--D-alanyl-D-alanine ligase